jgi:hypothetical protein
MPIVELITATATSGVLDSVHKTPENVATDGSITSAATSGIIEGVISLDVASVGARVVTAMF